MSTPTPISAPEPDDVAQGLAAIERYVAGYAPSTSPPPPPSAVAAEAAGETRRVRELRAAVAEAHRLVELQEDEAPLLVDTTRVRKRRRAAYEAARLHELASDPAALAYRDQRVRRVSTVMTMTAACIALAVSSIGVQHSVAEGLALQDGSPTWWAAFGVEPALSLPLLAAVGVQAYSAMRGRVVDRKSAEGRKLARTEAVLLALTLVLNCWPAFAGVWRLDLLPLIVHSLGPVAAVVAVWTLPTLWSVLAVLPTAAPTGPTYRANVDAVMARVRELIAAGTLPANPSATLIRRTLRCGMDDARAVRDALAGGA
ncbi:hypothetical protein ABZU32_35740 [Sphaerisporangium sp. NPDC005288]|uniref:hypothetical protein n=1 Tax=Sphaerisporangium sp. NPDC005288 TaxID=3155114 RepID=UPI0033B004E3